MLLHADERLLEAVIDDLESRILPSVGEEHRFRVRLDINALKMVLRSLQQGGGHSVQAATGATDEQWAQGIRKGEFATDDPATLEALEEGLRRRLLVHNPRWLS